MNGILSSVIPRMTAAPPSNGLIDTRVNVNVRQYLIGSVGVAVTFGALMLLLAYLVLLFSVLGKVFLNEFFFSWRASVDSWVLWSSRTPWFWDNSKDNKT